MSLWRALREWWRGEASREAEAGAAPEADAAPQADAAPEADAAPQAEAAADTDAASDPDAVIALASDELDLHTFQPREVADVVAEYVTWAAGEGKRRVRIIHGKGTGTLRRVVHAALARHPRVESFGLAGERSGSWGATFVELRAAPPADDEPR